MTDAPGSIAESLKEIKDRILSEMERELEPVYSRQDKAFDELAKCGEEIDVIYWKYKQQGLSVPEIAERVNAVPNTIYSRLKRHKDRLGQANDRTDIGDGATGEDG